MTYPSDKPPNYSEDFYKFINGIAELSLGQSVGGKMKKTMKKQGPYWLIIAFLLVGWLWTVTIHDIYVKDTVEKARRLDSLAVELENRVNELDGAWEAYIVTRERLESGSEAMRKINALEHRIDVMGDVLAKWRAED